MATAALKNTLLDPERFHDATLVPQPAGGELFEALRTKIDELRSASGASDAANAPAAVTATVTAAPRRRTRKERSNTMPTTQTAPASQAPGSNLPKFEELRNTARELGAVSGTAKDSQIKFALKVLEFSFVGAIDLNKNKHGQGIRDGQVLAEDYIKAQQGAVIFDTKADNVRKLVANLDKMIKLGSNPKWGPGEPLQTVNSLLSTRQAERKMGRKVDDAFNTLMRYATQQLKRDTLIHGDELKAFVYKREPGGRTAEDVLEQIRKLATQLRNGKVANCNDIDQSPELAQVVSAVTKRLTAIAKAKGGQSVAA